VAALVDLDHQAGQVSLGLTLRRVKGKPLRGRLEGAAAALDAVLGRRPDLLGDLAGEDTDTTTWKANDR